MTIFQVSLGWLVAALIFFFFHPFVMILCIILGQMKTSHIPSHHSAIYSLGVPVRNSYLHCCSTFDPIIDIFTFSESKPKLM